MRFRALSKRAIRGTQTADFDFQREAAASPSDPSSKVRPNVKFVLVDHLLFLDPGKRIVMAKGISMAEEYLTSISPGSRCFQADAGSAIQTRLGWCGKDRILDTASWCSGKWPGAVWHICLARADAYDRGGCRGNRPCRSDFKIKGTVGGQTAVQAPPGTGTPEPGGHRPGCGSSPRWTAPWCCPATATGSSGPTFSWCPTRRFRPTSRAPGTGPPNAQRSRPDIPLMSVSHSMSIVTVYVAGERHVVPDSATILSRANQTIDTLERYKSRLDEVSRQLSTAEIEDFVTLRDVMTVAQRLEMVRRISLEIDSDVVELGTDGRQLKLQLEELVGDNDNARELIVRDYHANPDPPTAAQVTATLEELDGLSDTELLDFTTLARVFGYPSTAEAQDSAMSSRGYRAMAGIPRLQFAHVDLLVRSFGSLQGLLAASANDLQSVEGIGSMWARHIREGLSQLAESTIADRLA